MTIAIRRCSSFSPYQFTSLVVLLIATAGVAKPVRAEDSRETPAPSTGEREWSEGQKAFLAERYLEAAEFFERSYALSSAVSLLFNIGQARRLGGDCAGALAAYNQFITLARDDENREEARGHVEALRLKCAPTPVAPDRPVSVRPLEERPRREDGVRIGRRTWVSPALFALASACALGAGATFSWSQGRYDVWSARDSFLSSDGSMTLAPEARGRLQDANDELLRSVRKTDGIAIGLSVAALAFAAAGLVVKLTSPVEAR